MTMNEFLLSIKDLVVNYGSIQALKGVNLDVKKGEIITLVGSNGAGKSTLMNAIMGIVPIKSGNIFYHGSDIAKTDTKKIVKEKIVLVPEGRLIFPALNVYDNLMMGGYLNSDKENQEEGENGISMEFKRDRHDPGKGNERDFRQTRQIDHAEAVRGDIANDKPEEDGKLLIERVCFKIPRKAGNKRDGADDQVILGAKIWIAKAAAKRIGPDGKQGETDRRHDGRRHDRRDKFPPPGGAKAKDTFQYTANERSTKDCTIAILGTDDAGHGNEGEADPHDDRQTAAKTPDREKLEKRADAG